MRTIVQPWDGPVVSTLLRWRQGHSFTRTTGHATMHNESLIMLSKSLVLGVGMTAAATINRIPLLFGASEAEIGGWLKVIGEYGVLVGLAIFFLWRDLKREQASDDKTKLSVQLTHDREIAAIEASKQRDDAQFKSRELREQQCKEQWLHSERRREALESKMTAVIDHLLRQRDREIGQQNISDSTTGKFIQTDNHPT